MATAAVLALIVLPASIDRPEEPATHNKPSPGDNKPPGHAGNTTARGLNSAPALALGKTLLSVKVILAVKILSGVANSMMRTVSPLILKNSLQADEALMGLCFNAFICS